MRWRYLYPQAEFPYEELLARTAGRGRDEPSTSCSTPASSTRTATGTSTVDYAKAAPDDICIRIRVRNAGPETAHAAPAPARSGSATPGRGTRPRRATRAARRATAPLALREERRWATWSLRRRRRDPSVLFCDNETQHVPLFGAAAPPLPEGRHQRPRGARRGRRVNPAAPAPRWRSGTSSRCRPATRGGAAAAGPGEPATWAPAGRRPWRRAGRGRRLLRRHRAGRRRGRGRVMRQAFAGMLWSKQFYHYDVARWLDGDPAGPPPPPERRTGAQRASGGTFDAPTSSRCPTSGSTPGSRPGTSPSTASRWPTSTRSSPRSSCVLMCREWYMHPNGQLPAYEWAFGDVNPPVHAWAALQRVPHRRLRATGSS